MKKFKFFALAFAALSFAACSDDAIDGKGGNTGTASDATPAYLTISFSANSGSSSRANEGDDHNADNEHGSEDSGHANAGTANETIVKNALVVVIPTGASGSGFAKNYTLSTVNTDDDGSDAEGFIITNQTTETYSSKENIQVAATDEGIDYEVVVVANPVESLLDGFANINSGITDLTQVRNLYSRITSGSYKNETATDYVTAAEGLGDPDNTDGSFMMANKEKATVTVKTENGETNPAEVDIDIERVLSKITFRPTAENNYIYTIKSTLGTPIKAKTIEGAFKEKDEDSNYAQGTFNEAKDLIGQTVYALFDNDGSLKGIYKKTDSNGQVGEESGLPVFTKMDPKTADEYNADTDDDKTNWYVIDDGIDNTAQKSDEDILGSIKYEMEAGTAAESTIYVKLEGYALINLSKEVNYVRHTITDNAESSTVYGKLDGTNYLYTPNWAEKNLVAFDSEGNFMTSSFTTDDWFYNTLAQVAEESRTLQPNGIGTASYFKVMPSDDETPGEVTGGNHTGSGNPTIGRLLGYCFENSVRADQQRHGLTTGISFVATMWEDAECSTPLSPLYRYAGNVFTSIKDIADAYTSAPQKIQDLAQKETNGVEITKAELEDAMIDRYEGNLCYYYTSEIKHFDNGDNNSMGVMEFAIMRNNIYSLSISNINDIGDPFIDPTPGIENESEMAYLEVRANIIPWIVRYNDIEF